MEQKKKDNGYIVSRKKGIADLLSQSNDLINESNNLLRGVYVFVSMDLTNSTLFKSRHKNMWPKFVSAFYETVMDNFGFLRFRDYVAEENEIIKSKEMNSNVINHIGEFQLWKTVGDEVLLYSKVPTWETLYNIILHIDNKRKNIIDKTIEKAISNTLSGKRKNNNEKETEEEKEIVKEHEHIYKQYFDIKTTVWIASCAGDINEINSNSYPNLAYKSTNYSNEELSDNIEHLDFMGPDIDEGFRLCEYAEKKQMIISPKLMYLLIRLRENDSDQINILNLNFKIVNYVTMKGVWENRLYPIIMFCQHDPERSEIELWKEMFDYDAFDNSLLYANIEKHQEKFLQDKKFSVLNLQHIYKNAIRENEMDALVQSFLIQEKAMKNITETKLVDKKTKFEFHISCLCYNDNKFWLTKHQEHGWSFGCIQVLQNTDYFEFVKQSYKKKYNLDIHVDSSNEILSFYSVNREKNVLGFVLGVVILVPDAKEMVVHDENNNWYSYEEAKNREGKKIDNYMSTLDKAYEILKEKGLLQEEK